MFPGDEILRQRDALKGTDDVVRAFGGEEAFIVAGAKVPVWAFVIFVAIKSPDAADHDDAAHPVVPKIAGVMKTEVRSRIGAFETDVIVKHQLGQPNDFFARLDIHLAGAARVISERS